MTDESEWERRYIRNRAHFIPWEAHGEGRELEFEAYKKVLARRAGATFFGKGSFVSPDAHILTGHFEIGANSWVAGGVIIRGHVILGENTSINPFSHIAGNVKIGNGVRIAGLVSIYGFNHGYADVATPIYKQKNTSKGVVIKDDVWIGANAVIVDGVTVAAHSIVAGGAVVTKSFPEYSILAGNPARLIRNRRDPG